MLPTFEDFLAFQKEMLKMNFKRNEKKEFKNDFYRLGLMVPRPRIGREAGFEFFVNGLRVKVWTTFIEEMEQARASDLGWVLITEGDIAKYFAHPTRRTKNFFKNLLQDAKACKERIIARPVCQDKKCRRLFVIQKGKGGGRYWTCGNKEYHGNDLPAQSWDTGLSTESMHFVTRKRKQRKQYAEKRRAEWKSVGRAKIIRKKFIITCPQNIIR